VLYRRDPDSSHWRHHANDWHVCLAAGLGGKRGHLQDPILLHGAASLWRMLHYGRSRAFSTVLLPFWMITTFPQLPNIQNVRSQEDQNLRKRNLQRLKQTRLALPHASYRSTGICKHSGRQLLRTHSGWHELPMRYLVIGGGISGVCCAEELCRLSSPSDSVTLVAAGRVLKVRATGQTDRFHHQITYGHTLFRLPSLLAGRLKCIPTHTEHRKLRR